MTISILLALEVQYLKLGRSNDSGDRIEPLSLQGLMIYRILIVLIIM